MQDVSVSKLIELILNWSEVWALLIPLFVLLSGKKQPRALTPVVAYLCIALVINLCADVIGDFKTFLPGWLRSNNPLYNLHSVVRFCCFSYYFFLINKTSSAILVKALVIGFFSFLVVDFVIFENFLNKQSLSGNLLAVEAYLLLILCMQYYLMQLQNEVEDMAGKKDFWVVTALAVFVVVNFFLFLFYVPMIEHNPVLAKNMWNIHNVAYLIFCTLLARAFYVSVIS